MKKGIALFFAFVLILQSGFANGTLKRSTTVLVKTVGIIDSEQRTNSSFVIAQAVRDSEGNIVIAEGAPVITDVQMTSKRSVGRSGSVEVRLKSVNTVNGQTIDLIGGTIIQPKDIKGMVLGVGLGLGLTIAWPMLFFLFKKGDAAFILDGTIINGNPVTDYSF